MKATEQSGNIFYTRTDAIEKERIKNSSKIQQKEQEIEQLSLARDFLLLKEEQYTSPVDSEIKIRNQITKGTIVEGHHARMILDKTIYCVKLKEIRDPFLKKNKILIQGYFD